MLRGGAWYWYRPCSKAICRTSVWH